MYTEILELRKQWVVPVGFPTTSQTELASYTYSERACLKELGGDWMEETPNIHMYFCTCEMYSAVMMK